MQRLLSKELIDVLPRLYEHQSVDDPIVYAKSFFPGGSWTWFVTEGQPEGNDFKFFGYVIGFESEWGYFSLRELGEVNVKGLVIERDEYFEPSKLSRCLSDINLRAQVC